MLSAIAGLMLAVSSVYASPVEKEITLAGNFGEPRINHFHCGIDIKTEGVEGKRLFAIADGYVSRITVGLSGFGNALYITHPDGHTSVYCHLKSFGPRMQTLLRDWQYRHESSVADVRLGPLDCPVARGQLVAVSGNTGASLAPHLHLELHDTRTGHPVDPLSVLGLFVKDRQAPMAHAFMVYPVCGEGVFEGGYTKRSFGFSSHSLSRRFTAWGKVGFGVWANDYMEATYNRYGVYETILMVDGKVVFRSCVDEIPQWGNRQVNFWGDYEHYLHYGVWYMKSFKEPGVTLPFIHTGSNSGIVDFNEERDYNIKYVLSDHFGNTSEYEFTVCGRPAAIAAGKKKKPVLPVSHDRLAMFSGCGVQLVMPRGTLADDTELSPRSISRQNALSPLYSFNHKAFPLATWAELGISLGHKVKHPEKLYVESNDGRYYGGKYENGWVVTRVRELGAAYGLAYDDQPPLITPIGRNGWASVQTIRLGLADKGSGIKSFKGYVDGQFVLFESVEKSPWVVCRMKETPVVKTGRKRHLRFIATDSRDNIRVYEDDIVY